ncbi:MAG: type II toxin-antitoxin system Phd/YefM family antitoxin [Actinomycetes bacterium]
MTSLSISELRSDISSAVKGAQKAPISISKHGEEVAVLVSSSMYEKMISALEELEDIAIFDEAISNKDESIPWEKARKDLGLA